MTHISQDLHNAFPDDEVVLRQLKADDRHFQTLSARFDELDEEVLRIEAGTEPASDTRLEEIKKQLGKFDEVVEILLERSGIAAPGEDRARIMAEVGRLFAHELDDADQALVAYTQALCEAPYIGKYGDEI